MENTKYNRKMHHLGKKVTRKGRRKTKRSVISNVSELDLTESLSTVGNEKQKNDSSKVNTVEYETIKEKILHLVDISADELETLQGERIFIQELNNKLNELQDTYTQNRDSASLAGREKSVLIKGVRISPGTMIFKDAYDGKSYNQTLTITNCGKHPVTIRIFPPTSKAFKMKPDKTGRILSSGISLVRTIKFLYTKPTAIPQALMDIYINNTCYRYELVVITCFTKISVSPKVIDFGEIDVGMVSSVKYLTITNSGTKQAQYSIDLGGTSLEAIINPLKGTVQPKESKKISIEIFGTTEGEFQQEFWIKTDPLQRVFIQGNFIEPSLKVDYPPCDKNFVVLYFPKTFVGVKRQKNVVIKNHSSTHAVFCVMGRTKDEKISIKDAAEKDINYRQFYINPTEGRLHSDQQYIMGLTFIPQKPKNHPPYYLCSVIVDVKRCRVGNASTPKDSVSILTLDEQNEPEQDIMSLNDMITILLYGEVEIPHIIMEPRKVCVNNLKMNEIHIEPLKILNTSKTLPILIKYNKVAFIEVEPKTIFLPPNQEVEATIRLRPSKMGDTDINVVFDMFYREHQESYNIGTVTLNVFCASTLYTESRKLLKKRKPYFVPGITPLVTNEVGYQVDDVRFNSNIEKPRQAIVDQNFLAMDKNNDALIAFPNDQPKSLRPWRNPVPCNTIFAKLPRIVTEYDQDYDLNSQEKYLQETTQSYYKNYIKSLSSKQQSKEFDESIGDYVTTNEKLILMQHLKMGGECPPIVENLNKLSLFVPLAPYELHNIIVTPKFIQLGRLAAHTECSNHFNVENKNGFPVHISIKAFYPSITIHHEQFILAKNARKNINFTYHSDYSGTHHIPVFVIINFFFVFDLTVLAKIVSNTVKCITKDILIVPTERTAFLELRNPINSELKFMIDTTFFHLESFPSSGVIPAKRNMICTITFNPEVGYMPVKEIAIVSESGAKEIVEVHFDRKKAAVALSTDTLNFGDIPLNTTVSKELSVKNNSDQLVPVNIDIENSDLFPEVTINPMRAFLWQKGDMVITFTVKLKEVVQFSLPVKIIFQYEFPQIVTVTGNVIFPEISLSPPLLKIQKIPSGAVVKTPFRVINASTVANFLSFPLQDFPEFRITTKTGENVTKGLTLGPKEKKEINLEFHPQEPVAYCIYLPYILNGTLGPPELNRPDSLRCSEYLLSIINDYKKNAEGVFPKLTAIKILCAAGKKWLHFSSTSLTFSSLTQPSNEFVVTNVSNTIHQITFKVTNNEAFRFMTSESDMALVESNIEISIPPEDSFKIAIEFDPTSYGTFTAEVPIYVKDYSETVTFNILKLSGSNPLPQIKTSKKACYFLPATIGSRLNDTLTIELEAHKCDGSVEVECENSIIEVWWSRQENISDLKIVLYYTIMFAPVSDCIIETKVKFSCACSASTEVEVYACGDSSIVSNFMADPDVVDQSTYPYYPAIDDKSDYAKLMHSMVPIIEGWLYTQGYMYQNYYKIPEDIARYPVNTEKNKKGAPTVKKKTIPQLPLVQLLINLMDQSILKYIDNGLQPSEELKGRTLYNYVTYRNTVSFLKSQGIFVPGLKPEHLLCYIEYLEYKNNLVDKQTPPIDEEFTEDLFYRFSKQKWLDLFFQIYKVLVFRRIVDPQPIECENKQGEALEEDFITKDRAAFEKYFKKRLKRFPSWFRCDAKLLLWLEYHYNRQRSVLWPNENFGKNQRFDNFSIIDDSVALATVTAAYCPYLSEQLRDVYACPKKLEHKVHNACKVVQVWKSLKLSFEILPQTIVTGNKINIFFIVTYLYEVLPHFYPTNDVRIEAPLSESASYELTVSNCEDALIQYIAIFFGEGSESFILDNQQIMIPGKQSKKIRLTYLAKKVLEANCILVLSGEASGQKYAKTMAISITGIPNISQCETIDIQVPTYEEVKKKISLQSPYGKSYNAKICMCFQTPKSYKDFLEVSVIKEQRIPREINVIQNECHFVGKGEATITLDMCLLSQGPKSFHLYFFNNTIGDFCILMNISPLMTIRKAEELLVTLPNTYNAVCSCKRGFNKHCPKAFRVSIPCRNPLLWKSMGVVVERCFFHSVALQWIKKYSGTPLVFRTFKFYLERFPQGFMLPSSIFEDHAEFEITPNKKYSTQSSTFKIPDVTGEDSIPLIIHWNDRDIPKEEVIELRNTNKKEIRYFKLVFLKPFSSSTLVSESTDKEINSVGSKRVSSNTIESIKESKESIISSRSK